MAYLIADGLILAVLLLFALVGAHRGFILSLCGLLAVLVAFVGASFAARTLSPMVADALEPKFASAIEEQRKWRRRAPLPCPPTTCLWTGY